MSLSGDRRDNYAAPTVALREDLQMPGAEAAFDQALTNGLLAIVAATILGHKAATGGHAPAARGLLGDLVTAYGKDGAGVTLVPTGEEATDLDAGMRLVTLGYERHVAVSVNLLRDALDRTQPTRHGRGPSGLLTAADLDALVALDQHPALNRLYDHGNDLRWIRGREADQAEVRRAADYYAMLDDDEVRDRVASAAREAAWRTHDDDRAPLQDCPVCEQTALVATGSDDFGYGIVAATCKVCSYKQSEHAAEGLNLDAEWEARWAHQ